MIEREMRAFPVLVPTIMAAFKRSASPLPELITRPSASNAAVTLYEIASPRRSKRLKTDDKPPTRYVDSDEEDIEDAVPQVTVRPAARSKTSSSSRAKPPSKKKTPGKPKQPRTKPSGEPHPPPPRWKETYDAIKEMRDGIVAAVDTMGCHMAQQGETDARARRLVTLISLMLSSQTKDEVTDAAIKKLRAALGGSITLDALLKADKETIEGAINKVGFWPKKTGYVV